MGRDPVIRRLLAILILALFVGGGYYVWRHRRDASFPRDLREFSERMRHAKLTAKVGTALSLNERLGRCSIQTAVEDGVVTLRGDVPDDELKRRAEELTSAVPGVRQVVNHLRVTSHASVATDGDRRTIGETIDDQALAVRVRLAFSLNSNLDGTNLEVAAFKRAVRLSGTAATVTQRQLAVRLARETAGVTEVEDRIQVAGAATSTVEAAQRALAANPNLTRYNLRVRQDGDRLVVSGRVRTSAEKDLAELLVRSAVGGEVDNLIAVRQ
jgi:osmotically-inducible protein OsmY